MLNKVQLTYKNRYTWRMDVHNQESTSPVAKLSPRESRDARLSALIEKIISQEEHALAEMYDICAGYVYGLALKICGDAGLAEEITSDVFVYAWQHAAKYDPVRGKVMTWLLTICRSRSIDALRRSDIAESDPTPDALLPHQQCQQSEPLNILQTLERNSEMYRALKMLDNSQQQMLSLAFFRGLSHQQIADFINQPLGTVKSQLRNAMISLRSAMNKTLTESGG